MFDMTGGLLRLYNYSKFVGAEIIEVVSFSTDFILSRVGSFDNLFDDNASRILFSEPNTVVSRPY